MLKRLQAWMEPRYTKIAIYIIASAIIIFTACLIIFNSNTALTHTWKLVMAVLQPLVLGLVISYLLLPLVRKLENKVFGRFKSKKLRRNLSVLLIYLIIAAAVVAVLVIAILSVTRTVANLNLSTLESLYNYLQGEFANFWDIIEERLRDFHVNLGSIGETVAGFFNDAKTVGSTILFAMIFSIYFLLDAGINKYWNKVFQTMLKDSTREKIREFVIDADRVFSGYIRGQALDALIMGAMVTIAFLIAGVPYAAVIGILTGFGNLIPFVGPVVGFASLIICCLTQGAFSKLIVGSIILVVVLAIDGNLINPKLLSTSVEVHPILVFLALIAGGEVGGLVGMLVAVPVAALAKQQFEKYVERRAEEGGIHLDLDGSEGTGDTDDTPEEFFILADTVSGDEDASKDDAPGNDASAEK